AGGVGGGFRGRTSPRSREGAAPECWIRALAGRRRHDGRERLHHCRRASMSRLISIVTPVHDGGVRFLPDAYESLLAQEPPDGWSWEWCVQEDGTGVHASRRLPQDDPRVRVEASRHGGPHVA